MFNPINFTIMEKEFNDMVSLNSEISEFDLQELEQRLETDPLGVGGLLDLTSATNTNLLQDEISPACEFCIHCTF